MNKRAKLTAIASEAGKDTQASTKRRKRSDAWKSLERLVATTLRGTRVSRGADFSKKDVDVKVADFPSLQIDAKYRQGWSHHSFLAEVERKYCSDEADIPILVTKHPHLNGGVVCLPLHAFGILLDVIRELRADNAELMEKRKGKK